MCKPKQPTDHKEIQLRAADLEGQGFTGAYEKERTLFFGHLGVELARRHNCGCAVVTLAQGKAYLPCALHQKGFEAVLDPARRMAPADYAPELEGKLAAAESVMDRARDDLKKILGLSDEGYVPPLADLVEEVRRRLEQKVPGPPSVLVSTVETPNYQSALFHQTCAPRMEVLQFAAAMEAKLKTNDHKSGWDKCDVEYLFDRLDQEAAELSDACVQNGDAPRTQDEAVDVANFAMMLWDRARKGTL